MHMPLAILVARVLNPQHAGLLALLLDDNSTR
jgi:hypothetical protein